MPRTVRGPLQADYDADTGRVLNLIDADGSPIGLPVQQVCTTVLNVAPNLTLNDTSGGAGIAATPFGLSCTVAGGAMGAASVVRVLALIDWVGGANKSTIVRIGPASGTWATAANVSGQTGLNSQLFTPVGAIIGNDNSLSQQRSTPANAVQWFGTSTALTAAVTNVDTALDWTIYIGVQFTILNGGNTATLRRLIVELLP